jgi:mannose-6-phosphate isomerase-like protein (cupin superfamily)
MKVKKLSKTQLWKRPGAVTILSILLLTGLFVCYVSAIITSSGTALATAPHGFTSTFVGPTRFDEIDVETRSGDYEAQIRTKGLSDVYIVTNTAVPGGDSGWHTHPGPSVVSVKSGTATVYRGDDPNCTPQFYPAGTGFVDSGGGHVHLVRNEGNVELELVAFQLIPLGAQRRIDAPNPGNCPF